MSAADNFGMNSIHDLLHKLSWEISELRERRHEGGIQNQYRAFNCAVTARHASDWIFHAVSDVQCLALSLEFGGNIGSEKILQKYLSDKYPPLKICHNLADGLKHRKLNETSRHISSEVKSYPPAFSSGFQRNAFQSETGYTAVVKNAEGNDVLAIEVFESALCILQSLVEKWEIEPHDKYFAGDPPG